MVAINYLTSIEFGSGALATLAAAQLEAGIARPFVVADRGLQAAGLLDRVLEALAGPPVAVYLDTPPNPTEAAVLDAAARYRDAGCDGIVAVGGGSPMDLGKVVALAVSHPGPLQSYAMVLGGMERITAAAPPNIAVPTTAGTGSEVGRAGLIAFPDGRKLAITSPHLLPRKAVCDPDLTLGLPPLLTAATGMDAFSHCVETYLSPRVNPVADAIALDGAARAWRWIERATRHGSDPEARWHMMMASVQGGLCFQKGLGAVHSLSHPLGALPHLSLHHGTLNAVILPHVLRFNRGHARDKYERLAQAFGLPAGADLADAVAALNRRLGLPATLGELGVAPDLFPRLADHAMGDHSTPTNPRPLDRAALERLFRDAL